LTTRERAVVAALVERLGRPIDRAEVRARFRAAGGAAGEGAFDTCLSRLRRKVQPGGLVIHTLSGGRLLATSDTRPEIQAHVRLGEVPVEPARARPSPRLHQVHTQNADAKHP
jgi:hypothetical protein